MRAGLLLDFLVPQGPEQISGFFSNRSRTGKRSPYQRTLFLLLGLLVVLSNASLQPLLLYAASGSASENFTATTNIDTVNSTATVDTVHNQTRLATTDAWTNVMGFESGDAINNVNFIDASTGWAVTRTGKILKTSDAGVLWTIQYSGPLPLFSVFFRSATEGWAVGGSGATGILLKYNSADSTWSAVTPSGAPTLMDIYFTIASNGWAVGASGKIYRTTTGGSSASDWTVQTPTTTNHPTDATQTFNAVYVDIATSKGIIVGTTGAILRTTDTGASWVSRAPANEIETTIFSSGNFNGLSFSNGTAGWLFGDLGSIFYTSDQGDTAFTIRSMGTISNPGQEAALVNYLAGNAPYNVDPFRCGPVSGTCVGATRAHGQNLNDGFFFDASNGFVVGEFGIILKTNNAGSTWTYPFTATNKHFYTVSMKSTSIVYVGGEGSTLLKTIDGASTSWQTRSQGRLHSFTSVAFANATTGIMVGQEGVVMSTFGGIASWVGIESPTAQTINAVTVQSGTTNAWVVDAAGGTYKTTNLLGDWSANQTSSTSLNDIAFASTTGPTLYSVGAGGKILKTLDGSAWSQQTSPTSNALNAVYASTSSSLAIAVGASGAIARTPDGSNWSTIAAVTMTTGGDSVANYTLYDVAMASNNTTGWIVGSGGLILKTIDGGTNWIQKASGQTGTLRSIGVVDVDTVWVVGGTSSVVAKSVNAGENWTDASVAGGYDLYGIAVASSSNFVLVGQQTTIITTTNGGGAFSLLHVDTEKSIFDVDGSSSTVYGAGLNGQIIKSADAGATWTSVSSASFSTPTSTDFYAVTVAPADALKAWAVGVGVIYNTVDGSTWNAQTTAQNTLGAPLDIAPVLFYDVDAFDESTAYAVGSGGMILKTVNRGELWTQQASPVAVTLQSVSVLSSTTAVAVGDNGTILKTTDGGPWTAQSSGVAQSLTGVALVSSTTAYATGDGGRILLSTNQQSGSPTWTVQTSTTTQTSSNIDRIGCSDVSTCYAVTDASEVLHTTTGGTAWSKVSSVHASDGIWVKDFETVVAVGGSSHWAARYTPTYTTPSTIISNNLHTVITQSVKSATLTATQTLNSGTITYYVANADPTGVACGSSTPWLAATSGSATSFGSTSQTKLYWCALLTSPSTSTSPRLTGITVSYETAAVGRSRDDGGGGGGGGGGCTRNCTSGPQAPTALPPTVSSSTSIQWNFSPSTLATEYILSQDKGNTTYEPLIAVQDGNIGSITERGRTPNTRYSDRVIQAKNSVGTSPATALAAAITLSETPAAVELDSASTTSSSRILLSRGNNPEITEFAIQERDQGFVQASGAFNQSATDPQWIAFTKWGQPAVKPDGSASTTVHTIEMPQFLPNREYRLTAVSRNLNQVQATPSPEAVLVSPIEEVVRVNISEPQSGVFSVTAISSAPSGGFSKREVSNSGFLFELQSQAITLKTSGWIHENTWTVNDIPKGTYQLRVRSRNQQQRETTPLTTNVILSGVVTPPSKDVHAPVVSNPTSTLPVNSPVVVSGSADLGSAITLTMDGVSSSIPVSGNGTWQSAPLSLDPGAHTLVAVARIGSQSSAPTTVQFQVSSSPIVRPASPRFLWPEKDQDIIHTHDIAIVGTAPVQTTVELTVDGRQEKIKTKPDGSWSIVEQLNDGTYLLSASTINAGGVRSTDSASRTIIVDTKTPPPDVAPLPPVITSPTDPYQSSSPIVTVRGRGPANTIILVQWQQPKGTTIAKDAALVADGSWSVIRTLTPGTYTLTAVAMVPSGAVSAGSAPVTLRIGEAAQLPTLFVTAPVKESKINLGTTQTVEFRGTATANTTVEVRFAGKSTRTPVPATGRWSATIDLKDVADSTYDAWIELIDTGIFTRVEKLTIDRTPAPVVIAAPVVDSPAPGSTIRSDRLTFTGTAQIGTIVEVRFVGQKKRSAVLTTRDWSISLDLTGVPDNSEGLVAWAQAFDAKENFSSSATVSGLKINRTTIIVPPPEDKPKDKPKDAPKDKPKDKPKDAPKDTPKDTPKDANDKKDTDTKTRTTANNNNNTDTGNTNDSTNTTNSTGSTGTNPSNTSSTDTTAIEPALLSVAAQALRSARQVRLSIGGATLDSSSTQLLNVTIPANATVIELNGQAIEPRAQMVVTLYSDPISTSAKADSTGAWSTTIDLSTKERNIDHNLTVKTTDSQGQTPEVTLAYLTIPLSTATTTKPKQASSTTVQAVTKVLQQNVVAPTVKVITATAKATVQVAVATHETIVQVEPQTQVTLAAVLPTVALMNPPVVATIPQIPFIVYHTFTWILSFLGLKKKRKSWGVVYNSITKEPIPLVIVRLMDVASKRLVETQVTDRTGRFGFLVKPGVYRLEVAKAGFMFPSTIVGTTLDGEYAPVYHSENIEITGDDQTVAMAIPMDPVNHTEMAKNAGFKGLWARLAPIVRKVHLPVMIAGVIVAIIVATNVPSATNIAIAALYALVAALQYKLTPPEVRPWGTVFDAEQFIPIPLALVDIIDTKYNKLLKSRLSDYEGRFAFLPPKGTYKLNIRKQGYQFPAPDVKPTKKYKNLYHGEEVVITKNEGMIAKDVPAILNPSGVIMPLTI